MNFRFLGIDKTTKVLYNDVMTKAKMYSCPICRKAPAVGGYPRKWQWKTQKGLDGHKCHKDEAHHQEQRALELRAQKEKDAQEAAVRAVWATENAPYKVGDAVYIVDYAITAPTHEVNRWGRSVKMRYEELRLYYAVRAVITGFSCWTIGGAIWVETDKGSTVTPSFVFTDYQEAVLAATCQQEKYDEALAFAAMCR